MYAIELIADDEPDGYAMVSQEREDQPSAPMGRGRSPEVRFGEDRSAANYNGRTGNPQPGSGEKTTPPAMWQRFGAGICTLDVASTADNALCSVHLIEQQDALNCVWPPGHWAWMNPPYVKLLKWVSKAVDYVETGGGRGVRALLPAWTDMEWFHTYACLGVVTFVRNRPAFGGMRGPAPFASIVIGWTKSSIKMGRARLAAGDTRLAALLDPLPPLPWSGDVAAG